MWSWSPGWKETFQTEFRNRSLYLRPVIEILYFCSTNLRSVYSVRCEPHANCTSVMYVCSDEVKSFIRKTTKIYSRWTKNTKRVMDVQYWVREIDYVYHLNIVYNIIFWLFYWPKRNSDTDSNGIPSNNTTLIKLCILWLEHKFNCEILNL